MWLNPINSYKYMSALEMNIVEDVVTTDLVADKYASRNPTHIATLRHLFGSHGLPVPALADPNTELRPRCLEFANAVGLVHEPAFAFLANNDSSADRCRSQVDCSAGARTHQVYVSTVETPGRFYIQLHRFYDHLENVNAEIKSYLARMDAEKNKGEHHFIYLFNSKFEFQLFFILFCCCCCCC